MISIIVPAFNSEKTIAACLDSLIQQSYVDKEIIVVDGASSDKTIEIVKSYALKHPFLRIQSEKDKGIYDAINKGIKLSKGEWIYILGSDDRLFESDTLQKTSALLKGINEGVVYGNVQIKGNAGWAQDGELYGGEFNLEKLLEKNICQQAVFYHRSLFEKIGFFNINYSVCADWDFMLHCAAKSKMKYVPITIAEFNGGGTSKVVKEEKFYEDLPGNLYQYFGSGIFRKEFAESAWRFKKLSEKYSAEGKRFSALYFKLVSKRLEKKSAS